MCGHEGRDGAVDVWPRGRWWPTVVVVAGSRWGARGPGGGREGGRRRRRRGGERTPFAALEVTLGGVRSYKGGRRRGWRSGGSAYPSLPASPPPAPPFRPPPLPFRDWTPCRPHLPLLPGGCLGGGDSKAHQTRPLAGLGVVPSVTVAPSVVDPPVPSLDAHPKTLTQRQGAVTLPVQHTHAKKCSSSRTTQGLSRRQAAQRHRCSVPRPSPPILCLSVASRQAGSTSPRPPP